MYDARIAIFVLLFLSFLKGLCHGQVRGTIFGPGEKKVPVAVSPLKALSAGEEDEELARQFAQTLARDLELSGIFRVISKEAYIEPPSSGVTAEAINFDNWSVIGAIILVKGTLLREADQLTVEARLFDVYQRRQLSGRRYRGGRSDLRRMAHRFADEAMAELTGERGPFDSRIAFLSRRNGPFKDVYVMTLDGSDVQRLTADRTINLSPTWSPTADNLLLTSYRDGRPELFSLDLSGRQWSRISSAPGLNLGGQWSPDGRRIALTLEENGNSEIFVLNRDGEILSRLTEHWAIDVSPTWSPDGERLAFCSNRSGQPQIYMVDSEGGRPRRVTYEGSYNTSPRWSPKGDRIAYTSRIDARFQIFTVNVDGTDSRQITHSAGDNEDPSWSPDGRYLVFSSTRGGGARLYLSDQDGLHQVELTDGTGDDSSPSWSGWLE
jgi:TolB protein